MNLCYQQLWFRYRFKVINFIANQKYHSTISMFSLLSSTVFMYLKSNSIKFNYFLPNLILKFIAKFSYQHFDQLQDHQESLFDYFIINYLFSYFEFHWFTKIVSQLQSCLFDLYRLIKQSSKFNLLKCSKNLVMMSDFSW